MKAIPVFVSVLLVAGAADALAQQRAQPGTDSGFYIHGGAGRAWANIDNGDISASFRAAGAATASTTSDDQVSAWKFAIGYQFSRYLALEASYAEFDDFKVKTTTTGPAATFNGKFDGSAFSLDVVANLPVSPAVDLFAKVGAQRWDVDSKASAGVNGTTIVAASESDKGTDWKFGFGARYNFTPHSGIQLEWERYNDVGKSPAKSDIDLLTVGLRYKW